VVVQGCMDDQVKQIHSGRFLAQLEQVPGPAVPLPPQLASFRMPFPMRPPFMPMMMRPPNSGFDHTPVPRPVTGPNPPGALVRSTPCILHFKYWF